jgi:Flp pilus assembly protein TadG
VVGQALVETALLAPFLLLLLVGGMQVAYLGYAAVSIDTAAREGARVAVENAATALSFTSGSTPSSYTCAANPATDPNPVCQAVANNAGLLKGQNFALVRIDTNVAVSQATPSDQVPDDIVAVGNCSNQNDALVLGQLSQAMALPVSDTLGDSTTSAGDGSFSLCMHGTGSTTQTVTITASGTSGGQVCTGQASTSISKTGSQWSASPSSLTLTLSCTTITTSTSSTTTTSTSTTSTFSTSVTFSGTPSANSCSQVPAAGTYVTVTVKYQASVLVPVLNSLLADSGQSYKTLTSVVTMRVEPCTT